MNDRETDHNISAIIQGAGYAFAYACSLLDNGTDPRQHNMDELLEKLHRDFPMELPEEELGIESYRAITDTLGDEQKDKR